MTENEQIVIIWIVIITAFGIFIACFGEHEETDQDLEKRKEALIHKKNAELEKNLVETRRAEVGKCDAVSNRFGDVYGWDLFKSNYEKNKSIEELEKEVEYWQDPWYW